MNDLLLWRHLGSPKLLPAKELVPFLEEMGQLSPESRLAYLGVLEPVLHHADASMRAAAVRLVGGAQGIPAWRILVKVLKDPEPEVRRAAVEALRVSAQTDPARWVHAYFHPDPEVQKWARGSEPPFGFAELFPPAAPYPGPNGFLSPPVIDVPPSNPLPADEFQEIQNIVMSGQLYSQDQEILESFLERGTEVDFGQRLQAAEHLSRHGHADKVFPLLVEAISKELMYVTPEQLEIAARGVVAIGSPDLENRLVDVLYDRNWQDQDQKALAVLLTQATNLDTRYWARDRLWTTTTQTLHLARLARTFAWGVAMGKFLMGTTYQIEMLVNEYDLGYTRLKENKVFITPLPILRGERGGVEVVRGLILHEFGHHLYHKSDQAMAVWQQGDERGLGRLLNLVADEHLERNLRQRSPRYGNLLKVLNAYAFQYNQREVPVASLLRYLGPHAETVLPRVTLGAARKAGHVLVSSGRLMREMEASGHSFARFIRALRMGLGNRTGDLRVAQGLALFKGAFRKSTMPQLLDIARRLRDIFGDETDMLNDFGLERVMTGDEAEWLGNGGGGNINPAAVQAEVERLLSASRESKDDRRAPGKIPAGWGMNLRPEETFKPITNVVKLVHDPAKHAQYARLVARPARQLRRYFQDLGLGLKPQRARIRGRLFDRTRTRDLLLKGDPRLLIARTVERTTDLFLGVAIDCSGSMAGDKLEKAKRFGTLLAESLKGQRGVDLRLFGFTDRAIFDAGDARFCAVHDLSSLDGNNDAAALWHVFRIARASRRKAKLLVVISDGLPTECTVAALKALVARLTRWKYCCAQVAVQPIEQICFPHYILLQDQDFDSSVRQFGQVIVRLVGQALGMG